MNKPICWTDEQSYLFANPCYSEQERRQFTCILEQAISWPGHIWLSTSGTLNQKWVGLSKKALLASATAVNQHIKSSPEDRWIHTLPDFHVGGISIWARSFLSGAKVFDFKTISQKWDPKAFHSYISFHEGTLVSLVPAQVYDLVVEKLRAPQSLRAVIVGGGALHEPLYKEGIALGWPLLPSYGMTECGSQVATAPLLSWKESKLPPLELLSHLQAKCINGKFFLFGPSLLSCYGYQEAGKICYRDPKVSGWFETDDSGIITNRTLSFLGRGDRIIKIGGEKVDMFLLESHFQTVLIELRFEEDAILFSSSDDRLGHCISLVTNAKDDQKIDFLIKKFNQMVLPFERIKKIGYVNSIPRTPLGKIIYSELNKLSFYGLREGEKSREGIKKYNRGRGPF